MYPNAYPESISERIESLQWIDQEVQPSSSNAGFTIDICCIPFVCAL